MEVSVICRVPCIKTKVSESNYSIFFLPVVVFVVVVVIVGLIYIYFRHGNNLHKHPLRHTRSFLYFRPLNHDSMDLAQVDNHRLFHRFHPLDGCERRRNLGDYGSRLHNQWVSSLGHYELVNL